MVPSKLQTPSTAEELPPVNEKAPTQDRMEIWNKFLATIPSQKEDKDSDLNLVTQQELDALKTTFSLPDGHVNIDLLKQTCKNNGVKYPAKLAKNFSAPQVRDLHINLLFLSKTINVTLMTQGTSTALFFVSRMSRLLPHF